MKVFEKENLSNENYHNSDEYKPYWSSSNIKSYLVTPREAHYQKFESENETSDAMTFGTQIHDFLAAQN